MLLKIAAHQIKHVDQEGIAEGVEDLIALFAVHNDLLGAQYCQMLRDVSLLPAKTLKERSCRDFSLPEHLYDSDARRMRQRLEDVRLKSPQSILHDYLSSLICTGAVSLSNIMIPLLWLYSRFRIYFFALDPQTGTA